MEAFTFLASAESRIYAENSAYTQAIASIINHILTLPKKDIEQKFLSVSYTAR